MRGEPFSNWRKAGFFLFYGCAKTIAAIYWEINKILLEMGKQLKKNLRTRGDDYDK